MFQEMSDGVKLYYEEKGSGDPVIFIGGWRMSTPWWHKQVDYFSSSSRAIFLDMRSCGQSENTNKGHRMGRRGKDLHDFINGLGLQNVTIVGWSQGSADIWSYVDLYGCENLSGVVMVDQPPKMFSDESWAYGLANPFGLAETAGFIGGLMADEKAFLEGFIPTMFTPENAAKLTDDEKKWMLEGILQFPSEHVPAMTTDHFSQDWRNVLSSIDVPSLFIRGESSGITAQEAAEYVASKIPACELRVIAGSSHCPFYEQPDVFNGAIGEFLAGLGSFKVRKAG